MERREAIQLAEDIRTKLLMMGAKRAEIAGSLRRGISRDVGDIDIVVDPGRLRDLDVVFDNINTVKYTVAKYRCVTITSPGNEIKGTRGKIQLHILFTNRREFGAALLYLTGDRKFNRTMEDRARKRGMTLSKRGLLRQCTDGTRMVAGKTERAIFNKLRIRWREPHERE